MLLVRIWKEKAYVFRSIVQAILNNQDLVDDILQEAFTRVLKSGRRFSENDAQLAFNYLRKAVLTTSIDYFRENRVYQESLDNENGRVETPRSEEASDPLLTLIEREESLHSERLQAEIRKALRRLSPKQRQAIELFFNRDGQSKMKDLCRETGVAYSTWRSRMLKGIDEIRSHLKSRGVPGFEDLPIETNEKKDGMPESKAAGTSAR